MSCFGDVKPDQVLSIRSVFAGDDDVQNGLECLCIFSDLHDNKILFKVVISGQMHQGEKYICAETSGKLKNLNDFLKGIESNLRGTDEVFSQWEKEVLVLLSQGKSSKEIADGLFIAEQTVKSHHKNMIGKAKVRNTAELIAHAFSLGVIKNKSLQLWC